MTRDLVTQNLLQLSELFLASTSDPLVLEELEDELRYRRDPMALHLLKKVRGLLSGDAGGAAGVGAGAEASDADAVGSCRVSEPLR